MLSAALAVAIVACPYADGGWTTLASKRDIPREVLDQVTARLGELADKSEPFRVTDVCARAPCPPVVRFISAAGRGCDLVLTYERGGRGYSVGVVRLRYLAGRWVEDARQ